MDFRFQVLYSSLCFVSETWFWISIFSRIPDSLICIPDSIAQDSGFHKQKFLKFWIPQAKISRIPDSLTRGNTKEHPEIPYLTIFLT